MRFCSGAKAWHSRPFSLKVKKVTWSIATNGHLLFAFKIEGASTASNIPKDELVEMLSTPVQEATEIPTEDLKAWAGTAPSSLAQEVPISYEHQGVLLGCAVDRRKLAYLLATVPFPVVTAWVYAPGHIGFEAGKGVWRAFLAGLQGSLDGDEPVFQVQRSSSVFDVAEEVGDG
jgi:hypothetical protein